MCMYRGRAGAQKQIGFFGDSFCSYAEKQNWMGQLADHFDSKVVHNGIGGSSYWTTVIDYTKNFNQYKNLDYTVFCWTEPYRIYHHKGDFTGPKAYKKDDPRSKAAQMYIEHLRDWNKERMEFTATAYWLDQEYLSKVSGKIIHLWSFGDIRIHDWPKAELKDIKFLHDWKHGIEMRTPLFYISCRTDSFRHKFENHWLNDIFHFTVNHMGPEGDAAVFKAIKDVLIQEKL